MPQEQLFGRDLDLPGGLLKHDNREWGRLHLRDEAAKRVGIDSYREPLQSRSLEYRSPTTYHRVGHDLAFVRIVLDQPRCDWRRELAEETEDIVSEIAKFAR